MEYLTKENITFILALFGSFGTLCVFISTLLQNSVNLDISIVEYSADNKTAILYMMLDNRSHLPISITNISIWNHAVLYSCLPTPEIVKFNIRHCNKEEVFREAVKTIPLPINLPSLSGTSGYLYFVIPQENFEIDSKSLTVEVSTNRHKKFQKTLLLPRN